MKSVIAIAFLIKVWKATEKKLVQFSQRNRYTARKMSEQTCETSPPTPVESDLLDPYERLVTIEVLGQRVQVPEKNRLLRCFQYLSLETISYGDFCWNGDCTNCQVWYHTKESANKEGKPALSCRIDVIEEMVITAMCPYIKLRGITK
jgi:hypothetical protein